jgi:hypothetical protein
VKYGTPIFNVISDRPVILTLKCQALDQEAYTSYLKVLREGLGVRTPNLMKRNLYQKATTAVVYHINSCWLSGDSYMTPLI